MLLFGFLFCCWYPCNQLSRKTLCRNDLLCVEWDVKPYTLTQYFFTNCHHHLILLEKMCTIKWDWVHNTVVLERDNKARNGLVLTVAQSTQKKKTNMCNISTRALPSHIFQVSREKNLVQWNDRLKLTSDVKLSVDDRKFQAFVKNGQLFVLNWLCWFWRRWKVNESFRLMYLLLVMSCLTWVSCKYWRLIN